MRIADLILELAKQPLDAQVLVERQKGKQSELNPGDIVYLGEVALRKSNDPQKSVLIDTSMNYTEPEHVDMMMIEDEKFGYHEVVFFEPFTDIQAALKKANKLKNNLPYSREIKEATEEHVRFVTVIENPSFEKDPGEEDAYLYVDENHEDALDMMEVRFELYE